MTDLHSVAGWVGGSGTLTTLVLPGLLTWSL
jgi:hypothetical protein